MSYPQQPYHGGYGPEPSPRENAGLVTLLAVGLPLLLLAGALALFITLSGTGTTAAVSAEFKPLITAPANQAANPVTAQQPAAPQDTAPIQDTAQLQNPAPPQGTAPLQATTQGQATAQGQTLAQPQAPLPGTQPSMNGDVPTSKVGGTLTLRGSRAGLQVAVTLDRLIPAATPANDLVKPKPGNKLVAVELSLVNRGQATYGDVPAVGAQLIDAEGGQYHAELATTVQEGQSLNGSVTISMGDTRKGVLVFELPQAAVPAKFQFAVDVGLSPQKGEWLLG